MFYLMTHSTHIYLWLYGVGHTLKVHSDSKRKEGNILFNDSLNTFYLQLHGVVHIVKEHSDSERGNLLLPQYGLHFLITSKGSL